MKITNAMAKNDQLLTTIVLTGGAWWILSAFFHVHSAGAVLPGIVAAVLVLRNGKAQTDSSGFAGL